jgi:hypothetical protein
MRSSASASDISAPVSRSSRYCRTSARSPRWGRQSVVARIQLPEHPDLIGCVRRLRFENGFTKQLESSSRPRSKNGRSWRQGDVKDHGPDGSNRRKADPLVAGRRQQRSSRMSSCRERRCRGPRSQPPGGENCLPEKHAKKYDNKDAKDKPPPTGTEGVIVLGGQPVGIAHVDTNSTPASRRCQSNSDLSMRCAICPRAIDDLRRKGAPLRQCGHASLFVNLPGDEMPLLIEMVVDLGVN